MTREEVPDYLARVDVKARFSVATIGWRTKVPGLSMPVQREYERDRLGLVA